MTKLLKNIPYIGKKYNSWEVISDQIYKKDTNRSTYWKVRCKCGKEEIRESHHLINERTKMCKSCSKTEKFKDTFALAYFNRIIKRSEKIGVSYNLTPDYLYDLFLLQNKKCALSGLEIQFTNSWKSKSDQTASLDRIDNSEGYIIGNVQWVHKDINFMKGKFSQERFIELCREVKNHQE